MCGFYFNQSNNKAYNFNDDLNKLNLIKHRGVDNTSYEVIQKSSSFFLGHHRLSINDPTPRSNQPLKSNCDKYRLLFNGEIFNFLQLKKNLDYDFKTTSDTEVILAGYIKEGKDFLKKLEGFFSILILDTIKKKIVATVDPTSFKTLYYKNVEDKISFSSEISCLVNFCKKNLLENIDQNAVQSFIQFGFIHAPYTIYKNINKLSPGELIEFDYEIGSANKILNFNKHFASHQNIDLYKKLEEAHASRLVADVPIAHFLSGGVDSNLSSLIYRDIKKDNERSYTLGIKDGSYDESKLTMSQLKGFCINHKILEFNLSEIVSEFYNVCEYLDEPFGDSSSILVSLLSKNVSKNYKVAISSDGGDELFYGYSRHKFYYLFYLYNKLPRKIKKLSSFLIDFIITKILIRFFNTPSKEIKLNKIKSFFESTDDYESYVSLIKCIPNQIASKILKSYKKISFKKLENKKYSFENIIKEVDYNYYLPMINFKNDRCGMQYSLEIREPLLNYGLVRSFYNHKFKFIDLFYSKRFFRSILSRNKINIKLKKTGFSVSQIELLSYDNFKLLDNIHKHKSILKHFFKLEFLNHIVNEFKVHRHFSTELWLILSFSIWLDKKLN